MADLTYKVDISTKQAMRGLKNLQKEVKKTDSKFAKLGKSLAKGTFKVASKGLKSLAVAATVAAAAFVAFGVKAINVLDDLEKASSKLGVSSRFLSSWQKVATEAGLTTQNFTIGLQRFLRRIGEAQIGTGTLVKPLAEMGISLRDANGNLKDGTIVFQEYIDSLRNTESATKRLRLAFAAFDTEGVAMVNIAKMSAEQIEQIQKKAEEAGIVIDTKLVVAAAKAKDAFNDLTDVAKGFGLQFFGNLAGPLEVFTKKLREKILEAVAGAGGMEAFSKAMAARFLEGLANFLEVMASLIDNFINAMNVATNTLKSVIVGLSPIIPNFSASFGDTKAEKERILKEIDAIQNAIDNVTWAGFSWDEGFKGMTTFGLRGMLAQANKDLQDLADGTVVFFEKVATDTTAASDLASKGIAYIRAEAEELTVSANESAQAFRNLRSASPHLGEELIAPKTMEQMYELESGIKEYHQTIEQNEKIRVAFREDFDELSKSLFPVEEKIKQLVATQDQLTAMYNAGAISVEEYNKAFGELADQINNLKPENITDTADALDYMDKKIKAQRKSMEESWAAREEFLEWFERLQEELFPAEAAADAIKEKIARLNEEFAAGNIENLKEYTRTLAALKKELFLIDPEQAGQRELVAGMADYPDRIQRIVQANQAAADAAAELAQKTKDDLAEAEEIAAQATEDLTTEMTDLYNRLNPVEAATKRYAAQVERVNKALDENIITEERHKKIMKQITDAHKEFLESADPQKAKTWAEGWKEAFEEYSLAANDAASSAKETFRIATRGMEDAIVNFAKTGKLSFKSLLQDIAEQILRSQIRVLIAKLFGGGQAGGGWNWGIPGFAGGGYLPAGQLGIVGERGPELIKGPATITPMTGQNSSSNVTYHINAVDTDSFRNLLAMDPSFIHAVVQEGAR